MTLKEAMTLKDWLGLGIALSAWGMMLWVNWKIALCLYLIRLSDHLAKTT